MTILAGRADPWVEANFGRFLRSRVKMELRVAPSSIIRNFFFAGVEILTYVGSNDEIIFTAIETLIKWVL